MQRGNSKQQQKTVVACEKVEIFVWGAAHSQHSILCSSVKITTNKQISQYLTIEYGLFGRLVIEVQKNIFF